MDLERNEQGIPVIKASRSNPSYQAPPVPPAQAFLQQQQQGAVQAFQRDQYRVEKVESAVGGAIETATNVPVLGALLNPALKTVAWVDKNVFEPVTEALSAGLLVDNVSRKNPNAGFWTNLREARSAADEISFGQALASDIGEVISGQKTDRLLIPFDGISSPRLPRFMQPDFDVLEVNEREAYFKDDWLGIAVSGAGDLGLMLAGTKAIGTGWRAGKTSVLGSRQINSPEDLAAFESRLDGAVESISKGNANRSDATVRLIEDAAVETDPTKLLNNALVAQSNNPNRAATILSRFDNSEDIALYLKAERGNKKALEQLFERQASAADALDNYGFKMDPMSNFDAVHALPDRAMSLRLGQVLADLRTKDADLANALDNFAVEKAQGIALSTYQPGRFAAVERLQTTRARAKVMNQFGDLELLGKAEPGSWKVDVYNSGAYDRAVRLITFAGAGRPQGHVNVSNPRRFDAEYDIASELSRIGFLKGRANAGFKREVITKYASARTDTARAQVLADMEKMVLLRMAQAYGVRGVRGVGDDLNAVKLIDEWHSNISARRQGARDFIKNNDGLLPDADGNINVINLNIRATEAQTVSLLDFRALELEVVKQMRRSDVIGNNKVTGWMDTKRKISNAGMAVGTFFDIANMVFSNLVLLRLAYIPKNAMLDPYARASMDLETVFGLRQVIPGIDNIIYNNTMRANSAITWGRSIGTRKAARGNFKTAEGDVAKLNNDWSVKYRELRRETGKASREGGVGPALRLQEQASSARAAGQLDQASRLEKRSQKIINESLDSDKRIARLTEELAQVEKLIPEAKTISEGYRSSLLALEQSLSEVRSKRRMSGDTSFTLQVGDTKYELKGLADPNVKGANAYLKTISAMDDYYASTRRSEISNRISASKDKSVPIDVNDWPAYTNALAHIANRHIRNELEEIGGMALRGESVESMMGWLYKTTEGRDYLRRMADRLPDKTRGGVEQWVRDTQKNTMRMFPDERIRETILQRKISVGEIDAALRGNDMLPKRIIGPDIKAKIGDADSPVGNSVSRAFARFGDVSTVGWRAISGVENRFIRNPLFQQYARDEMTRQVRAAQNAGIDVTQRVVHNEIRQSAYRLATERVEQTLYSARRLTNAGYYARYLTAFPAAYYNSQVVAARLLWQNPANAIWYAQVTQALDAFAPYVDDDGNTYKEMSDVPGGKRVSVSFPLYDMLGKMPSGDAFQGWYAKQMGLYTDPLGGGMKLNPRQMEFMLGDPTISWMGNIAVSEIVKNSLGVGPWKIYGPEFERMLRDRIGDDVYEENIIYGGKPAEGDGVLQTAQNAMTPSYIRSLLGGLGQQFFNDENGILSDRMMASRVHANYKLAIRDAHRNGAQPPTPEQTIKATGVASFIMAAVQFGAPIATTFDPVTRSMTQAMSDLVTMNGGDYEAAQQQFVRDYGIENLALVGSSMKNNARLSSVEQDVQLFKNHGDLMYRVFEATGGSPEMVGLMSFGYNDTSDDYSQGVAAFLRNQEFPGTNIPMMEMRRLEETLTSADERMGWYEYTKLIEMRDSAIEEYGLKSTATEAYRKSGLKAWFNTNVENLSARYSSWDRARNTRRSDFWGQDFTALEVITDDGKFMRDMSQYGSKWSEVADWVNVTQVYREQYKSEQMRSTGSRPNLKGMRELYANWHFSYVNNASPEFQVWAARYLSSIPDLEEFEDGTSQ